MSIDVVRKTVFRYIVAEKIQVLDRLRPILYILLNHHPKNVKTIGSSISRVWRGIFLSLFVLATWIFFVSDGWFCMKQKSDLKTVALPFSLLLGAFAMKLIYISFWLNGDQVISIISLLQKIVENRKKFYFLWFFKVFSYSFMQI